MALWLLCDALKGNNTLQQVSITAATGSFKEKRIEELSHLLSFHPSIKSWQIDVKVPETLQNGIIRNLKKNTLVTQFEMPLSAENEKIVKSILDRNHQI